MGISEAISTAAVVILPQHPPRVSPFSDAKFQKRRWPGELACDELGNPDASMSQRLLQGDDSALAFGDHAFDRLLASTSGPAACAGSGKRQARWRQWVRPARQRGGSPRQDGAQGQAEPVDQELHDGLLRLRAPRRVRDRCRAWLDEQQERWRERRHALSEALKRVGSRSAREEGAECQVGRLLPPGARSDSGDSAGSADGCVRVVISDVATPRAKAAVGDGAGAVELEPVTLHDVWHTVGAGSSHQRPPSLRTQSVAPSDAWFDAISSFDPLEPSSPAAADDIDSLLCDAPATAPGPAAWLPPQPPCRQPHDGPHVPSPPLLLADREYVFVPVPNVTGFAGYWLKDQTRTTQGQPIDVMLGSNNFTIRAHDTIPGIWLQESAGVLTMTAKPRSIPLGPLSRYTESFAKDGSSTVWNMRRDIAVGRTTGQLYFTACGTLIFRVYARGLFSSEPVYVCEEYSRLEDGGRTIVSLQRCKAFATGRVAEQYLVGRYLGPEPPPGHA